jgi:DNA polymerase-3 subunit delta
VDRVTLERCLSAIRRAVLGELEDEWNLTLISGEKASLSEMLDASRTLPLLGGRRLVIVRGIGELISAGDEPGQKEQVRWLRELARGGDPAVIVVLVEPPLDGRLRVHKALVESACIVECGPPSADQMPGWIAAEAREHGLKLGKETAETLAAVVGSDTTRARNEIEKLSLFVGDAPATPADVSAVVSGGAIADAWRMCDEVARLDASGALRIARRLTHAGEEPLALLGALAFRLRQLLRAAEARQERQSVGAILGTIRAWGPTRSVIEQNLQRYDARGLLEGLRELHRADRAIKRGGEPSEELFAAIGRIVRLVAHGPSSAAL